MRVLLGPRKAFNSLDRITIRLSADDIAQLTWDDSVEKSFQQHGGPVVRVVYDDGQEPD